MADASGFGEYSAQLQACPYWVVASQTCNLYNPSLEAVPMVELIGASPISDAEFSAVLSNGSRPRLLHSRAYDDRDDRINLELRIQDRVWLPREALAECSPSGYRVRDLDDDPAGRWKETFTAWMARSYTRAELPDEFNDALSQSKLGDFLSKRIAKLPEKVQGIYFGIRSAASDDDVELTPDQVARLRPPYELELTIVIFDEVDRRVIEAELEKLKAKVIPAATIASALPSCPNENKVSRLDVAKVYGIEVNTDVVTTRGWTVHDLMRTIRYTEFDYLSSPDETGD